MFKKLVAIAALAALVFPAAASAAVTPGANAVASAQIQPLCHTVSLGAFNFGPIIPNGQTSNTSYGQGNYDYAGSSLTNDCVTGTTYSIALFDSNNCQLQNGGQSITWNVTVNGGGTSILNCGGVPANNTAPPSASVSFQAGATGTNTIQLVGFFAPPTQSSGLNAGTYTDNVTAFVYF